MGRVNGFVSCYPRLLYCILAVYHNNKANLQYDEPAISSCVLSNLGFFAIRHQDVQCDSLYHIQRCKFVFVPRVVVSGTKDDTWQVLSATKKELSLLIIFQRVSDGCSLFVLGIAHNLGQLISPLLVGVGPFTIGILRLGNSRSHRRYGVSCATSYHPSKNSLYTVVSRAKWKSTNTQMYGLSCKTISVCAWSKPLDC